MKSTLVIDQGNTTLKATLFQGEKVVREIRFPELENINSELLNFLKEDSPAMAIYSHSGEHSELIINAIEGAVGCRPLILRHDTPLPIEILYQTSALGLDRMAAAVGANEIFTEYPECEFFIVADAGTALTIDLVSAKGKFLGGNISAGLRMRMEALHEHTAALPEVRPEGEVPSFGFNTATAIRSGAIRGMGAEISGAYARTLRDFKQGAVILTGGDAGHIKNYIDPKIKVVSRPMLVAEGLNRILYYNENIFKTN